LADFFELILHSYHGVVSCAALLDCQEMLVTSREALKEKHLMMIPIKAARETAHIGGRQEDDHKENLG